MKKRKSGMPKEVTSHQKRESDLYFMITGCKDTVNYSIHIVKPGKYPESLYNEISGIQDSQRWIARFVKEHYEILPIYYENNETVITDRCVKPGRDIDAWNQWKLGSYL
jgi:uncharacterized membrane protein